MNAAIEPRYGSFRRGLIKGAISARLLWRHQAVVGVGRVREHLDSEHIGKGSGRSARLRRMPGGVGREVGSHDIRTPTRVYIVVDISHRTLQVVNVFGVP